MKVWFFYEEFKGSKGHWHKGYDAMIEHGGHMTCGTTLGETIFMAHDLIACLTLDICQGRIGTEIISDWKEEAGQLGIPETAYVGEMELGTDILPNGSWVRRGDASTNTRQPFRHRMLKRAFCMSYRYCEVKSTFLPTAR